MKKKNELWLEKLNSEGYVVLENVLSQKECDHFISLLEECVQTYTPLHAGENSDSKHGLDSKENEKIVFNLHNKDFSFLEIVDHPVVYPILSHMLREGSYQNSEPFIHTLSSARSPLRGAKKQQLHNDSRYPNAPWPTVVFVLYCLEDFTKEKGATRVVPGSHRYSTYPENGRTYPEEVILEASRGSAIVVNGSLWHGSSKNVSGDTRWGMIYSYARWFHKTSFDFNRNMPEAFYDRMTDTQKELFGYKFNPPKDEFESLSGRSVEPEKPKPYSLMKR
jgi:ectoine hydroxylase-related dioxygenase (phytanoyl-CoA dioxygenase family)